ncbi:MAG: DUF2271 domain-containing protein [Cellulophaga sp.]
MKRGYKKYISITLFALVGLLIMSFAPKEETVKFKCMIQMINYSGEKAYVAITLINPEGNYEKTLYVQGDDEDWFRDLKKWWGFSNSVNESLDGLTGATIGNGERKINVLEIASSKIDAGYKVRFETAVENQEYHITDAEVELNSATIKNKVTGSGYIRYVRMIPN